MKWRWQRLRSSELSSTTRAAAGLSKPFLSFPFFLICIILLRNRERERERERVIGGRRRRKRSYTWLRKGAEKE